MPATTPKFAGAILGRHLGRKAPIPEQRAKVIPLRNFVKLAARPVPATCDLFTKAKRTLSSMMGNDEQGDCVAVTVFKELGIDTAEVPGGTEKTGSTSEVLRWYHQVGGPGDNGLYIIDALNFARDKGFTVGGVVHKIDGYVSVDHTDDALMNVALILFGGLHVGTALPNEWYQNAEDHDVWDLTNSGIVGGHSIPFTGYDAETYKLATWARQPRITRRAVRDPRYVDEVYATLGKDWFGRDGIDMNGLNVDALKAALEVIRQGGTPEIPTDPNPPPTPPGPPPGPPPVPGELTLEGSLEVFGQLLPIKLKGRFAQGLVNGLGANWIVIARDVLAIITALGRRDWVALMTAVEQLLKDIGISFSADERHAFAAALMASAETLQLTDCNEK